MPVILQKHGDIVIKNHSIPNDGLTIGRSVKNTVFLDDPAVSQNHAQIAVKELKDGSFIYFVKDLDSTNQTKVNGNVIQEHLLCDQDEIEIGLSFFKYIDEDKESLAATKQFKNSWIPGVKVLKN